MNHLFISARAGSGKTTRIMKMVEELPKGSSNLILMYNKVVAEEAEARLKANGFSGTQAMTINKLGYQMTKILSPRCWVKATKLEDILFFQLCGKNFKKKRKFKNAPKLCAMLKCLGWGPKDPMPDSFLQQVETQYNLDAGEGSEYYEMVRTLYRTSCEDTKTLDFDDQVLFPTIHGYQNRIPYDNIFVDESQDLNQAQINLLKLLVGPKTRLVAVGDPYQAIYGFRGASHNAVEILKQTFQMEETTMPTCWRCSQAVIAEARGCVPDIVAKPDAEPGGIVVYDEKDDAGPKLDLAKIVPSNPTFILCRTRAPLIGLAVDRMNNGKPFQLKLGSAGVDFIKKIHEQMEPNTVDKPQYIQRLEDYLTREVRKLKARHQHSTAGFLEDTCTMLKEIAERVGLPQVPETIDKIFSLNGKDGDATVTLMTIHQSKGLEAYEVFLYAAELLPHPFAKSEWELEQEENLKYIAITRAQMFFNYVFTGRDETTTERD